jgi:hypothetical protein
MTHFVYGAMRRKYKKMTGINKDKLIEELARVTDELVEATEEKDSLEVELDILKAQLLFSAEVDSLKNQTQRDAQLTILLHADGWDRKIAQARTRAKVLYYRYSSLKTIIGSM